MRKLSGLIVLVCVFTNLATLSGAFAQDPFWGEPGQALASASGAELGRHSAPYSARQAEARLWQLAAAPAPQSDDAAASKAGEAQTSGACGRSGYVCGSRYPYCCYSENKGYYCRQDARHC